MVVRIPPVRRLLPLGCGLLLTLLGPVSGWAGASSSPNAGQLLSEALSAAGTAQSVHFVDKTTVGKVTQVLLGSLSAPTAGEWLSGTEPLEVELIKGLVYVSGSATALESALQLSASQAGAAANKWVVVQSSDEPFQSLTQTLTVSGAIANFVPNRSTAQLGKRTKVHGIAATRFTAGRCRRSRRAALRASHSSSPSRLRTVRWGPPWSSARRRTRPGSTRWWPSPPGTGR